MHDDKLMPPLLTGTNARAQERNEFQNIRVALFFDLADRQTTGNYVKRALEQLCSVSVFHHTSFSQVPDTFDLYLAIDDSSHYVFPSRLKPSAIWLIDTHLTLSHDFVMALGFDYVFCAQRAGAILLYEKGFRNVHWLPLACDPGVHHQAREDHANKKYDVGFVGNLASGARRELLESIKSRYPNSYIGRADHTEMASIYGESRIVFNISIHHDLNMRVFEGLCSGSTLLTDVAGSLEGLFTEDEHLFLYRSPEEAVKKTGYLLQNPSLADRVAEQGYREVLANHTYVHRALAILRRTVKDSLLVNEQSPAVSFISRHSALQWLMLTDFFNMWLMLPIIDGSLFTEKLKKKIQRAYRSALRRMHIMKRPY